MSNNKVDKAIKRKKSMLISSIGWGVMAAALGFLLTLILSCIAAYKTSYVDALSYLATSYFNLILEIANRNPGFAHFILHSQTLAEAQIFQGLNDGQAFILGHFSKLQNISAPSGKISNLIDDATYHLYGFLYLAKWSLKLDIIKFISVFCSLMVFIFAGFLGLLDGLLTRYIRTAEGGRESTYVYHHLADALFKIPFCLVVAYIALPFPLNPLIVVVILAVTTFMFCRVSGANLKKFI